jgi:cytidine deaminase
MSERATEDTLLAEAWRAREAAYAPYSNFPVGAAVLTASGQIFSGANVENASYGLSICAERTAIFAAVNAGERRIQAIAVVTAAATATPPCGACRQVIWEFGRDAWVVAENRPGERRHWTIRELLPNAFEFS